MIDPQRVIDWNEKFGNPKWKINVLAEHNMLQEEVDEFLKAADTNDTVEMVDGLIDIIHVALGSLHKLGLDQYQIVDCFNEVYASNNSKSRSEKNGIGKIMKWPDYFPPNLEQFL